MSMTIKTNAALDSNVSLLFLILQLGSLLSTAYFLLSSMLLASLRSLLLLAKILSKKFFRELKPLAVLSSSLARLVLTAFVYSDLTPNAI